MDRPDVEIKKSGWDSDKDQSAGGGGLATETGEAGNLAPGCEACHARKY